MLKRSEDKGGVKTKTKFSLTRCTLTFRQTLYHLKVLSSRCKRNEDSEQLHKYGHVYIMLYQENLKNINKLIVMLLQYTFDITAPIYMIYMPHN